MLGTWLLPESKNPDAGKIDLLSAGLSALAIVPIVYAVKQAVGYGVDWSVFLGVLVGLFSGWLFIRRQRRLEIPLVDTSLFRIPAFSGAVASSTVAIFAFLGLLFFFSQYLQLVRGYSPLKALYRAQLEIPSGTSPEATAALEDSLASTAGQLRGSEDALFSMAQEAFTHGM